MPQHYKRNEISQIIHETVPLSGQFFFYPFSHIILCRKEVSTIKRTFALLLCIIFCFFALPSCAKRENPPCRDILSAIMETEIDVPAGKIYNLRAPRGNDEYLEERVINSLFGDGSSPPMRQGWLDLALFLPTSAHPCELAVFLCDTPDTATDTARLLCRRLDTIRSAKANTEYSQMLSLATVTIIDNYVLLTISRDPALAIRTARSMIK